MEIKSYNITVTETSAVFGCKENEIVINAMIRAKCGPVGHGCCGGGCGVCKMKVVSGKINVVKRMSRAHVSASEEKDGVVLICCIQPCGDVSLSQV